MKILVIMGSPRKGDSYEIVRLIEKKMKVLGSVDFEYLFLKDAHLEFCKGCCACFMKGEDFCPLKDDREKIERAMYAADGVIFASPVYVVNVTALMKNFIDRFAYRCHRPRFFDKYAMLVSNAAFIGTSHTLKALDWAARMWGFNIVNTLGLRSLPFSSAALKKKTEYRIGRSATKFYDAIRSKQNISPSLFSIVGFKLQKKAFMKADKEGADFKYWKEKGWLENNSRYYFKTKVNLLKQLAASLIFKISQAAETGGL